MKSVLHILNKPMVPAQLPQLVGSKDAVLLIENGVLCALNTPQNTAQLNHLGIDVFALTADLSARGLDDTNTVDNMKFVDYDDFVNLTVSYDLSKSW